MNERGFVLPSPLMLVGGAALFFALTTGMFFKLYRGAVDDYATFRANVETAMGELHRIQEVREAEYAKVAKTATDGWNRASRELRNRPPIRVLGNCNTGGLSPVSVTPGEALTPTFERTISAAECEAVANNAVYDAAQVLHLQAWILKTHEASKKK